MRLSGRGGARSLLRQFRGGLQDRLLCVDRPGRVGATLVWAVRSVEWLSLVFRGKFTGRDERTHKEVRLAGDGSTVNSAVVLLAPTATAAGSDGESEAQADRIAFLVVVRLRLCFCLILLHAVVEPALKKGWWRALTSERAGDHDW